MSVVPNTGDGKITVPALLQRKSTADSPSQKIICLTAYDYPTARLVDEAGVDVILELLVEISVRQFHHNDDFAIDDLNLLR